MEQYDVNIDHARHSIGGDYGHIFRTHPCIHGPDTVCTMFMAKISSRLNLSPEEFVSLTCLTILLVEAIRLKSGIVIVGQRIRS